MKQLFSDIDKCLVPMQASWIGITGRTASGKDTVADYLVENHGYRKVTVSDLLKRKTSDHSKEGLIAFQKVIRKDDPAAVGKILVTELKKLSGEKVVVAGIRTNPEWETVKAFFPETKLVFVHANAVARYKRIKTRNRAGDPVVFDDFLKIDFKEEHEFDFDKLENVSSLTLVNDYK